MLSLSERSWFLLRIRHLSDFRIPEISVADPECLSRIQDPDFYPSRIQKQQWKTGVKNKICCHTFFFGAINFTKLNNFYFLPKKLSLSSQKYGSKNGSKNSNERQRWKKKFLSYLFFWSNKFHKIELFLLSLSSQKCGFGIRDPRSGKNLFRIPYPRVKKAPDPGSATLPEIFYY